MSVMKNILVEGDIQEEFERCLYDLNQFLNCLSCPVGSIARDNSVVSDGTNSIDYRYSDPSVVRPLIELKLL